MDGSGGAATVRTSVRLPKPKAPRALDITSVIREALGPIEPTLARKQIKRAFVTPDGISDNVSNVKSRGYPQRVTDERTLQQMTEYYEHVILWLHRATGHIPIARLRQMLEAEFPYPKHWRNLDFRTHCDICLRAKSRRHNHSKHLDAEVHVGDHHAVDVRGPYPPTKFYENTYKVGII